MSARLSGQGRERFAQHHQPDSPAELAREGRTPSPYGLRLADCSAFDRTVAARREQALTTCRQRVGGVPATLASERQAISPGIPPRLLPLTARAGVGLDRPGGRLLKLSLGHILDGSTPNRFALRRSAGASRCRRGFLTRRGHARGRLLALHCTPPFGFSRLSPFSIASRRSPTSQISWWSWAAILMSRSAWLGMTRS